MDLVGCLLLDKAKGITSFEAVDGLRKGLGCRKAGHIGTLDPLATGLLLTCLGRATKLAQFLVGWDKEYIATIKLGVTTDTWDKDGTVLETTEIESIPMGEIENIAKELTGEVEMEVPQYSAVRVGGKRLHQHARAGKVMPKIYRKSQIYSAGILDYDMQANLLTVKILCSKGTYIRSWAYHFGLIAGTGATLWELRRTGLGPYRIEDALTIDRICDEFEHDGLQRRLISPTDVLSHMPRIVLADEGCRKLRHGVLFGNQHIMENDAFRKDNWVRIVNRRQELLAVGRTECDSETIQSEGEIPPCRYERVLAE
jgi:tRNA pseudouridine55 synthase